MLGFWNPWRHSNKRHEHVKSLKHDGKDYRKWVTRWTEKIEKEFRAGNAKTIYEGVKALRGTKK